MTISPDDIRDNPGAKSWEVLGEEHFWQNRATGSSGFIDIIAGYGMVRWIIECKRGAGATWLFLARKADQDKVTRSRMLCTDKLEDEPNIRCWSDLHATPDSTEGGFCVVRGQADKEPMLERIAANLLDSVESFADEELQFKKPRHISETRYYQPVIVTTATLLTCRFDPADVDLGSGPSPVENRVGATFLPTG